MFFRAPFGVRNPMLDQVLARAGLTYATWTRRGYDTRDDDSARVLRRLVSGLRAGDVLMLHDGYRGRDPGAVLSLLLDELDARGLRAVTLRQALR